MVHITSTWAGQYGLADPQVPAGEVYRSNSAQIRSLAQVCHLVHGACADGTLLTASATVALRAGWSNEDSRNAAELLRRLGSTVADVCAGNGEVIDRFAAAIDLAHQRVRRAYADVEGAAISSGLAITPADASLDALLLLERRRSAVVMLLHQRMTRIRDTLDHAAAHLIATMGPDPHHGLPQIPAGGRLTGDGARYQAPHSSSSTDAANRAALRADLTSASSQHRQFARAISSALDHAADSGQQVQLLDYDPDSPTGQGGVSIAVGDVGRADSVAVIVPGVHNSPSDAAGSLDLATALADATRRTAPGSGAAAIIYLEDDVPLSWSADPVPNSPGTMLRQATNDSVHALDAHAATTGGAGLARFTSRLRSMMDPSAGLTLIGHSYGSMVVSQAAARLDPDTRVDDIVLLAAPGAGYGLQTAGDYPTVDPDHVYTLAYPADPIGQPITDLLAGALNPAGGTLRERAFGSDDGPFGVDPNAAGFGAQIIDAPSNVPVSGPAPWQHLDQHAMGNYLSGAGLRSIAAITAGRYPQVPVRGGR